MIPNKYRFYVFSFIMSLLMSGAMSFAFLVMENITWTVVMEKWPFSWFVSMLIAFPMSLFIVPLTDKLVSRLMMQDA
ncbi:DUF2798 domain-containing protein [Curvivirga sp.]|uniref:DUF2798 domain-containing protein n=1 Tax=Curvivirga sp. TaxID=2856848 RepID=UPI003B58B5A5